jgi:hypothetical protein
MDRSEAFKTLRLDESADGQMVQAAYWTLVRQAQDEGTRDVKARFKIEAYNQAYATLSPDAHRYEPPPARRASSAPSEGTEFLDRAVDWLSEEARRTRVRWADRLPEICVIGAVSFFLMIVALGEGASFVLVFIAWLVVLGAIWAPWRKVHDPEGETTSDVAQTRRDAIPE